MEEIEKIIEEKIRPLLVAHGGGIELVSVTEDGWVTIKLTGGCSGCPSAQQTIKEVVEAQLCEACPKIKGVLSAPIVSDELINQALNILRKGK